MVLLRVTFIAALGGFLFGYDIGLMGGALLDIKQDWAVGEVMEEILMGSAKAGAVLGTLLGGAAMLRFGRRKTLTVDAFVFMVGPLIMALSPNIAILLVGRVIVGVAVGISAVTVPVYLGELAPARLRGRLVESYEVMLTIGGLVAVLANAALHYAPFNWRLMVGAPIVPATLLAVFVGFIPESPRWLVVNGRLQEALGVIHRVLTSTRLDIGTDSSNAEVEAELLDLWSSVEKENAAIREQRGDGNERDILHLQHEPAVEASSRWNGGWIHLDGQASNSKPPTSTGMDALLPGSVTRSDQLALENRESRTASIRTVHPTYLATLARMLKDMYLVLRGPEARAVRLALVLAFLNQAFASTSIISYAPTLLYNAGISSTSAANLATGAVSAAKLVGVLLAVLLVDRAGRRPLLLVGSISCSVGLCAVGIADAAGSALALLIGMAAFVLAFSASWAGVFWVLLSELFSMGVKSPAASAATATLFASGAVTDAAFLSLHSALGAASFALYAVIALFATVYVAVAVPETRGRTLAEVQALLAGEGTRDALPADPEVQLASSQARSQERHQSDAL